MPEIDHDDLPVGLDVREHTHPDRLATIARLHGVPAPAVERCSVLEIGCGTGGNLAAMAMSLPEARLVGIDPSKKRIETGERELAAAKISNVELRAIDLAKLAGSAGTFD